MSLIDKQLVTFIWNTPDIPLNNLNWRNDFPYLVSIYNYNQFL